MRHEREEEAKVRRWQGKAEGRNVFVVAPAVEERHIHRAKRERGRKGRERRGAAELTCLDTSSPKALRTLSLISCEAFLVKVTAKIDHAGTPTLHTFVKSECGHSIMHDAFQKRGVGGDWWRRVEEGVAKMAGMAKISNKYEVSRGRM